MNSFFSQYKIQIVILITVVLLIGFAVFISLRLMQKDETAFQAAPVQTKPVQETYEKLIVLNSQNNTIASASSTLATPTLVFLAEENSVPQTSDPSPSPSSAPISPTPTEIILAKAITSPVLSPSPSITSALTALTPTITSGLPNVGFVQNGLILLAASAILIFFAFLF